MTRFLVSLRGSGLALTLSVLSACSVQDTLDQEEMTEISAACSLTGSRMLRTDGGNVVELHYDDNTPEKRDCVRREIERRNLATWAHLGNLGAPELSAEERECLRREIARHGLDFPDDACLDETRQP